MPEMTDLDLTHIAEALVIHPGDHVLIRVDRDRDHAYVETQAARLGRLLAGIDVELYVIAGADQIAVIRYEEADDE